MAELWIDGDLAPRDWFLGARGRLCEPLRPLPDTRHGLVNRDTGGFSATERAGLARRLQ